MPAKRFSVVTTIQPENRGRWDWAMRIEGVSANDLQVVRSVTYGLHPAYPNPNRVIRNPENGFELQMRSTVPADETWGRFDVRVTIACNDGTREIHIVPLDFANPDGSVAHELWPLPAIADFQLSKVWFGFLKRKSAYGYARQVLDAIGRLLESEPMRSSAPEVLRSALLWLAQQRALCTYKDPSLPSDTRLRDALAILEEQCNLNLTTCDDPETLGLGGAVYKRLWEVTRSRAHLELALAYYRRGYQMMLASPAHHLFDSGAFTGVNVVYVSELLALETPAEVDAETRQRRLSEAHEVRLQLIRDLEVSGSRGDDWWLAATLFEVLFGLACRDRAYIDRLLAQAETISTFHVSAWERESTGSQLLRLARLQKRLRAELPEYIDELLGKALTVAFQNQVVVQDLNRLQGKVGLALSGGGFRASLFHIGVLARMAELDLLRHIEVISCVSGGSIVGAHYYLLLRKVLQEKADGSIDRKDYVDIVKDLSSQFLDGVQKNLRMRVAASLWTNLRMLFQPSHYSRTQRLGELYEECLYSLVDDGEGSTPRWLNEAFILPRNQDGSYADAFSPKADNWRRGSKVPMLVLNATTLNTGRNWQFTASFMGEPLSYGTAADATERLDPIYFSEAPERWRQFRLGYAVAASSCVPALFTPIVIPNLFNGRTVRLVDGGVHDNQGIRALLDQDCDVLIVSDASGQMDSLLNPPHGELGVALRTNTVLQARVRIAQHQELQARVRSGQLRDCMFLHLRKDLERAVQSVSGQTAVAGTEPEMVPGETTGYGIEKRVQLALAALRTDLDSFSDREALALMYSGYRMADTYVGTANGANAPREQWRFLNVADAAAGKKPPAGASASLLRTESLLRHLRAGSQLAFKVWHLHPALKALGAVLLAAAGIGLLGWLIYLVSQQVHIGFEKHVIQITLEKVDIDLGAIARNILLLLVPIILAMLFPLAKRWINRLKPALNPGSVAGRIAFALSMAAAGWILCRLHLCVFDRLFLRLGRVRR
ncbi:MAG: patatin-like phospholipase family protein [Steroidobacteraceae bacterium]